MKNKIAFVTGSPRSGSTWLCVQLKAHPQLHVPYKAINYFNSQFWVREEPRNWGKGLDWYLNQFEPSASELCIDISNAYFMDPEAARRIYDFNPDSKVVILLRNPYESALSHYLQYKKDFDFDGMDFFNVIKTNYNNFLDMGLIYRNIEPFRKLFPTTQILYCIYDDLCKDPKTYLQKIYAFLDVDSNFIPSRYEEKINQRVEFKCSWIRNFHAWLTKKVRNSRQLSFARDLLYQRINTEFVFKLFSLNHKNSANAYRELTTDEIVILKEFYAEDLQEFLQLPEFGSVKWATNNAIKI